MYPENIFVGVQYCEKPVTWMLSCWSCLLGYPRSWKCVAVKTCSIKGVFNVSQFMQSISHHQIYFIERKVQLLFLRILNNILYQNYHIHVSCALVTTKITLQTFLVTYLNILSCFFLYYVGSVQQKEAFCHWYKDSIICQTNCKIMSE